MFKVNPIAIERKHKHIVARIVMGLVFLLTATIVCLQIPQVQTRIISNLLSEMRAKMDGDISFGAIKILPFNTIIIKDVLVSDAHPYDQGFFEPQDTAIYFQNIVASFSPRSLVEPNGIRLRKVTVAGGLISSVKEGYKKPNFNRIFGTEPADQFNPDVTESEFHLYVRKFNARDLRIRLLDPELENKPVKNHGIKWMDMEAHADIKARDLSYCGMVIEGKLIDLQLQEKSGYQMLHAEGSAKFVQGHVMVRDFHMKDPWTDFYLPEFDMIFKRPSDMKYFTDKVRLRGDIEDSRVALKTVGYFCQLMENTDVVTDVRKISFDGVVNEMEIKELDLSEKHGTTLKFSGRMKNIEHPVDMSVNANLKYLSTSTKSAQAIINGLAPGTKIDIRKYAPGQRFTIKAKVNGDPARFNINANLASALGSLDASCSMTDGSTGKDHITRADVNLCTNNLDVGAIIGNDILHQCTIGAKLSAGIKTDDIALKLDSLNVRRLNLLGYDYSGIAAAGTYMDNSFNGKIISSDPNLSFLFQGIFNLSKKTQNALYKFYFNLGYADLNAINLDRRGPSKASAEVIADYIAIESHELIGNIDIRDLKLENKEGKHKIGDISISSRYNGNDHRINLNSGFATIAFIGDKGLTNFLNAVQDVTANKYLPAVYGERISEWKGEKYNLDINLKDTRDVMSFALPGFYLASGTSVKASIDTAGRFTGKISSPRAALGTNYLKGLDIKANTTLESMKVNLTGGELSLGSFKMLNDSLNIEAKDNLFDLGYNFINEGEDTFGDIRINGRIMHNQGIQLQAELEPSRFAMNGFPWDIKAESFSIDTTGIKVSHLDLTDGHQDFKLNGGYSKTRQDTLDVSFRDFRIEKALTMLKSKFNIKGIVNGDATITSPFKKQAGLVLDITSDSTYIANNEAGLIRMSSIRSEDSKETRFMLQNDINGKSTISAIGSLYPEDSKLAVKVNLDSLCLGYFSGLASSVFSEVEGSVSGNLSAIGPLDNLSVFSRNGRIEGGKIRIAFTNVPYYINGPFHLNDNGVVFDNVSVSDGGIGAGNVTGGIDFNRLKDLRMNTHISLTDIKVVDISKLSDSPIYGTASAGGIVDIVGPFDDLNLSAKLTTSGRGEVGIPLVSRKIAATELLTFKEDKSNVDPYEEMLKSLEQKKVNKSGLGLNLTLNITPEIQTRLVLDKRTDNAITGRGNGKINISIPNNSGNLNIRGDYMLNEGLFHFAVMGIASRNFEIKSGSSISFTGDIMNTDLNIDALYSTKAALDRLFGDDKSVQARRTVNCGLHVYDKLRNPQLRFSIEVPDLNPATQTYLQSLLNTEDKVQRQFLSLLVSNNFLPNDDAGIVNNSSVLLSNAAEIMAGQLSNILKMLNIPLDLGFNYQQSAGGTDIFDVAVSTQLFNNRVLVNGTVGNRDGTTNKQDIVGDLDIEMKLNKSGDLRASLFSHSADKYTNYLDDSQRNGLGVSYQQEFNTFNELFMNIFKPKVAKEARKAELIDRDKKMKTIKIQKSKNERKK